MCANLRNTPFNLLFVCLFPQMTGKWYLVGLASNSQWFVRSKTSMKMGAAIFTPTADGDLDMAYSSLK